MHRFGGLGDQIAASLDVGDAILDGEVIAADETGRPQFYDLLRDTRAPTYVAFDVIWPNGVDLRPPPLTGRREHLQNTLRAGGRFATQVIGIQIEAPTLANYRAAGKGPSWKYFGQKPLTTPAEIERWATEEA